jgi:DNA-binding XRE family transcriptional regulator
MSDTVTMSKVEYQNLIDARDHALAMRDVASGTMNLLTEAETVALIEARTPLAFWRRRSGMTQEKLAEAIAISQPYLAQMESGRRVGDVVLYVKLAKALNVRVEDLVEAG